MLLAKPSSTYTGLIARLWADSALGSFETGLPKLTYQMAYSTTGTTMIQTRRNGPRCRTMATSTPAANARAISANASEAISSANAIKSPRRLAPSIARRAPMPNAIEAK